MARYHINYKGEPGLCRARKTCPFGDMNQDHFDSKQQARAAFEKIAETKYNESQARRRIRIDNLSPDPSTVKQTSPGVAYGRSAELDAWENLVDAQEELDMKTLASSSSPGDPAYERKVDYAKRVLDNARSDYNAQRQYNAATSFHLMNHPAGVTQEELTWAKECLSKIQSNSRMYNKLSDAIQKASLRVVD